MRKYLILTLFLLVLPTVFAQLEECQRVTLSKDIPCIIYSTEKPTTGCAANLSIFLENGNLTQVQLWEDGTPFCKIQWNITTIATYIYNSTIETGVITVQKEDNMLSIIILQIFIIGFFVLIGAPHKMGVVKLMMWGLALVEFWMAVWFVYIVDSGGSINQLLFFNSMIVLIVGGTFGVYSLIILQMKIMKIDTDAVNDDGYTKWVFKDGK